MVLRGYRLQGTDLTGITQEIKKISMSVNKIRARTYAKLLGNEIAFLVDKIALNVYTRDPTVSIYECACSRTEEEIRVAQLQGLKTPYNLQVYGQVFTEADYTYFAISCILLSDESIFSAEKCNIGRYKPTSEVFLSLQNQIKEIEQIGFFLTVHDQKKIIVTPSKKFLTALCQRLETGTLAKGTNIFAYCYLASRCVQAKEFIIIGRKEEKDSSWVKGFHAASTKYAYIPQHFILRELQNFQENHDVTTLGWELSNYYTTIELIFQDKTVDMGKTQVKLGVKYSLSDVGTSSQTVQPILVYGDNSVLIGKSFSSPHRSKKTPEEIGKELVNAIEKQLPELEAKITATFKKASTISVGMDEQEKIISKIMKMIHTEKVGVRRKQYITQNCPYFPTVLAAFQWLLQFPAMYPGKMGYETRNYFKKAMGEICTLSMKELEALTEE